MHCHALSKQKADDVSLKTNYRNKRSTMKQFIKPTKSIAASAATILALFINSSNAVRISSSSESTVTTATNIETTPSTTTTNHHNGGTTRIAGYQTKSTVTGSKIDLDQAELERHLNAGDFEKAKQIYKQGAHVGPYANLHLEKPIPVDYTNNSPNGDNNPIHVIGMTEDGRHAIFGQVAGNRLYRGQTSLSINYNDEDHANDSNNPFLPCAVGGREDTQTEGCLASKGGLILEGYGAVDYHYNVLEENGFWGTLYGFSEHEAEKMFHCKDKCPYPEYEKFYHYYGQMDYGDLWIEAALEGTETKFAPSAATHFAHGSQNFEYLSTKGRAEAVKTATVSMNVFTQVNRIMTEWSIDKCHEECTDSTSCSQAAEPWDQAVATYAGSLEGADGTGNGYLFYGLADQLCGDFATCGKDKLDTQGTSGVNLEIIQHFQAGRSHLEAGNCDAAQEMKLKINQLMMVPLIQATLRSAYRLQKNNVNDDEERGRASAFVASVLPDLYACSHMDASVLYENLRLSNSGPPNFQDIKAALERNYECMNIKCDDVGGLYNPNTGLYYESAEPCGHRRASKKSGSGNKNNKNGDNNRNKDYMSFNSNNKIVVFVLCSMVVVGALIVKRRGWLPAVSSQVDSFLSERFIMDGSERRRGGDIDMSTRTYRSDISTYYDISTRSGNERLLSQPNQQSQQGPLQFFQEPSESSMSSNNDADDGMIEYA